MPRLRQRDQGCSRKDDGLQWCRGTPRPGWKCVKEHPDFSSYRREDDNRNLRNGLHAGNGRAVATPKPATDYPALAARRAKQLTAEAKAELAALLRLPVEALDAVPGLGWWPEHRVGDTPAPCWTIPETDAAGVVVGIGRRFREPVSIGNGKPTAKASYGCRGLVIPPGWTTTPGPVVVVEGASDVIALTRAGVAAIGRPSNSGGATLLAELLTAVPPERKVIVAGENDKKPDGKHPGKEGAEAVAAALAEKLGRKVPVVFPPADYKDAREWVGGLAADQGEAEDWPAIGAAVLRHVEAAAVVSSKWPAPKFVSELCPNGASVDWIWHGFIARSHTTLFSALMKSGKTTLVSLFLRSLQNSSPFLGRETRKCRTLLVSEESETLWAMRRDAVGLDDHLSVLSQPLPAKPSYADWNEFVQYVADQAAARACDLVVFDTLSKFAPWKSENESAEVQDTVNPFDRIAKAGRAVLAFHHFGKTDGSEGRAARGSTALAAAFDILIELRRYKSDDRQDRRRVVSGLGRFDEIPDEVVIELSHDGTAYTAEGDRKAVAAKELNDLIRDALPAALPGLTTDEVHAALPEGERPRRGDVMKALRTGAEVGIWSSRGTGRPNDPYRFWRVGK